MTRQSREYLCEDYESYLSLLDTLDSPKPVSFKIDLIRRSVYNGVISKIEARSLFREFKLYAKPMFRNLSFVEFQK